MANIFRYKNFGMGCFIITEHWVLSVHCLMEGHQPQLRCSGSATHDEHCRLPCSRHSTDTDDDDESSKGEKFEFPAVFAAPRHEPDKDVEAAEVIPRKDRA